MTSAAVPMTGASDFTTKDRTTAGVCALCSAFRRLSRFVEDSRTDRLSPSRGTSLYCVRIAVKCVVTISNTLN